MQGQAELPPVPPCAIDDELPDIAHQSGQLLQQDAGQGASSSALHTHDAMQAAGIPADAPGADDAMLGAQHGGMPTEGPVAWPWHLADEPHSDMAAAFPTADASPIASGHVSLEQSHGHAGRITPHSPASNPAADRGTLPAVTTAAQPVFAAPAVPATTRQELDVLTGHLRMRCNLDCHDSSSVNVEAPLAYVSPSEDESNNQAVEDAFAATGGEQLDSEYEVWRHACKLLMQGTGALRRPCYQMHVPYRWRWLLGRVASVSNAATLVCRTLTIS